MSYPADRKYTSEHEWVMVDGGVATIGITHHAQDALGEIVHVELPAVGKSFKQGDSAAEVESVKAVSDVYAPVSGTITEVNDGLDGNESSINSDPHGAGWLFKMSLSNPSEVDAMMDAAAYKAHAGD
ncbi:MAG: glycine cleavage system protein GcvH [Deltaproteobacteria bacterium]|nr:glycine cleavage system protein GcvH [Deltaproteobacteria bacterium]